MIQQGAIYWLHAAGPDGSEASYAHPYVVLQEDVINQSRVKTVVVCALTSNPKRMAEPGNVLLEAGEARVKTLSAYSTITAPFSGLVTKRYADPGAMIQAGISSQTQAMPVVRLSQISSLRLILPIPESAVPRIQIGRRVAVKVSSLNQTFAGKVARFSGKIDPVTHTMETEVDVPNPRSLLKPGMYASAEIELDHKPAALTVPVQAIVRKEGKATVMVVNAKKQTEVREVVTEMETPEWVEVVSGLNEGDIVIIGNQAQLKPGQSVEAKITTLGEQKGGKH